MGEHTQDDAVVAPEYDDEIENDLGDAAKGDMVDQRKIAGDDISF